LVGALSELIDSARRVAPAAEANTVIGEMREQLAAGAELALSYEIVVPVAEPWTYLTGVALPRLVYFLDCRGQLSENAKGIFVSAFVGERLYFFDAGVFLAVLGKKVGMDIAALREKWGEKTGGPSASAAPKLLGQ
jgi:hypothetical protein